MKVTLGRQTRGPGITGNVYDAVTQLWARVEDTTDAAVTEGQKNVHAAVNTGANYLCGSQNFACLHGQLEVTEI